MEICGDGSMGLGKVEKKLVNERKSEGEGLHCKDAGHVQHWHQKRLRRKVSSQSCNFGFRVTGS